MAVPVSEDETTAAFNPIYRPLTPATEEIRLVCILPASDDAGQIRIAIKHVCLTEEPVFTALSYTWGAECPTYEIKVYDADCAIGYFNLRQNLHDFLVTMRNSRCTETWFWIDQICINQDNNAERSQQVSQMAELYSQATSTTIWLGMPFQGSDEFMDFISHSDLDWKDLVDGMGYSPKQLSAPSKGIWDAYNETCQRFLNLPYWSRVWIIQEVALSSERIVHLGSRSVCWPLIYTCLRFFGRASHASAVSLISDVPVGIFHHCTLITQLSERGMNPTKPVYEHSWQSVVTRVRFKQCSNPRDKAYGVLGLLPKQLRIYPDYAETLTPAVIVLEIVRKEVENNLQTFRTDVEEARTRPEAAAIVREHMHFAFGEVLTMTMWCHIFYLDDPSSYNARAMRICLRKEIFDKFREQRAMLGGRGGRHSLVDAMMSRILFPNRGGLTGPRGYALRAFKLCNELCIAIDYLKDVVKDKSVKPP
jgi:hypothetical protein